VAEIGTDINKAITLLRQGELVAIPTETVYGLAGNALNPQAIVKIFEVKERPSFDPLIVHVPDLDHALKYIQTIPEQGKILAEKFWPGPLTLLLSKKEIIPDIVTSGLDTVGIRCPNHSLARQLLLSLDFPLAAPSANPFGYVSPTKPEHVNDQLGDKIKYILDGGPSTVGIESTIVGFEGGQPVVYRMGGLSVEQVEATIGKVQTRLHSSSQPQSPGQLKSHYAPLKEIEVGNVEQLIRQHRGEKFGILSFQKNYLTTHQLILSPSGDLLEASQNLFTALRELDKLDIEIILTEWVPDEGLGRAINDRLKRASAHRD
jgi:L-threonylcarbamoyladenylate synthase